MVLWNRSQDCCQNVSLQNVLVCVSAAKGAKTPVSLHGGERAVVRVVGRVSRASQVFRDDVLAAQKDREDAVVLSVRLRLVECEEQESAVGDEASVIEERHKPELKPVRAEVHGGVVAIVDHVGSDEHPLRQR